MGILRDTSDGTAGGASRPRRLPAAPAQAPAVHRAADPGSAPAAASGAGARTDLERRRDALAEQVTELHWDLGGLAYEMAIRDHFRLDVLVRRAALLQERDAELAEVERLLRMEQDGVAGNCPSCAAPHSRGALYCWQCGTTLMERAAEQHGDRWTSRGASSSPPSAPSMRGLRLAAGRRPALLPACGARVGLAQPAARAAAGAHPASAITVTGVTRGARRRRPTQPGARPCRGP